MIETREHDFFYLKEKKYFKRPKYTYSIIWKLIQKYKKKKKIIC
mgnify:CR=1 FL=1